MKRIITSFIAIALVAVCVCAQSAAPSASQILQKSAAALLKSGGVTATYTLKAGGGSETGSISVKGKKFAIISSSRSIWYDGASLWTLDPSEKEVTLSAPTAGEVASVNPYLLVSNYKSEYTARLVKGTVKGTYNIQLTPKNRQNYVKSATLCLRASNYMPVRMDVTDRNGNKTVVVISNVKTGVKLPESTFKYSAKSHPGIKLVDLK